VRLDKLTVENFRVFDRIDFEFDDNLNLIVGWNGTGKSSLLYAIRAVFNDAANELGDIPNFLRGSFKDDNVRFEMHTFGQSVRFERMYPAKLVATYEVDGKFIYRQIAKGEFKDAPSGKSDQIQQAIIANVALSDILPFFAFYGPKRNTSVSAASPEAAAKQQLSRRDGYRQWFDALIDAEDLQTWVIAQTLERLQISSEGGPDSQLLENDELGIVNRTLEDALPDLKGLRYDLRFRTLMVEFHTGKLLPFNSLSDGERGFISLIADICRRILIMNPQLGDRAPQETPGILMIDELDIHLHPEWQRRILQVLRERFPLLQIFATSHSPLMIGGLKPEQVLLLSDGKVSHPEATYGQDANRVLEDVMEVGSREKQVQDEIRLIFRDIEDRKFEAARDRLGKLRSKAPDLPEYVRAEALIRRVEVVGR